QAAALGLSIDPNNPLYAGDAAPHADLAQAPEQDFGAAAAPSHAGAAALTDLDLDLHHQHQEEAAPAATGNEGLDFGRDAAQETALPTPASVASESDADHFLDFDLGGLSFEPISTGAPIAMPGPAETAAAAPAEPSFDLDFHLPPDYPSPASASASSKAEPLDEDMDFALDLPAELGGHAAQTAIAPAGTIAREPVADPLTDLDAMDFDLPESPAAASFASPVAATSPAEPAGLELEDFLAEQETAPTPAIPATPAEAADAPEFDLSGIDLDLDTAGAAPAADGAADEALSAVHMEMDTKLDLAIAYQEIGDKEGARELIDEVIKDGSDEQVAKANSMRALLG
ncbi:MAG TPA: FimV/HubP family polar landmark protein, partial [Janthinobacterium sp.]|nr:FimV/HubP family polar landmark protein [Janthinobacterium sp.]